VVNITEELKAAKAAKAAINALSTATRKSEVLTTLKIAGPCCNPELFKRWGYQ
jgi:hypothetical protein